MLPVAFLILAAAPSAVVVDKPAGIVGTAEACITGRTVDGDTADVKIGARTERLRLLDIDTEESHNSVAKKITPFGLETAAWTKNYIEQGGPCWVEYGPERKDVYDRTLAFLWIKKDGAWQNYNLETVKRGYAPYFTKYGYSHNHHAEFAAAQKEAQEKNLGVWDPSNEGNLRGTYLGPTGLIAWWNERADSLAAYEKEGRMRPDILDTRMHWELIRDRAGESVTVFTAIRNADEKGAGWVGKCEGKLYQPYEIVAKNGESTVEDALKAAVGKYRYFTGKVALSEDRKTLRMEIASPADLSPTPPPKPGAKAAAAAAAKATPAPKPAAAKSTKPAAKKKTSASR